MRRRRGFCCNGANRLKNALAHLKDGGRVGNIQALGGVNINLVNPGIEYGLDLIVGRQRECCYCGICFFN